MKTLKNILITFILSLVSSNLVFAENYIMLSNAPISSVECSNNSVVSVRPLASLMNEKKTIIVSPIKNGSAELKVRLKNRTLCYKCVVKDGKIDFSGNRVIKIVPLDLPPEILPQGDSCQ